MKNIVAISVEKVQQYIYKYIDQNQKDNKTLENIISASNNISKNILNKIQEEFNIEEECKFLWISGKVIFSSDLLENQIREKLIFLYEEIYIYYHGSIFLNYSVFPKNNLTNMEIIKKSNTYLKSNSNKVKIIEENKELLFNFQEFQNNDILKEKYIDHSEVFSNNIDDLVSTDGKIAIVKADINDLGKTMENIEDYNIFEKISEAIEKYISLKYFGECIKIENTIFPFYLAGDDIFYAVNINYLFDSIKILKKIMQSINNEINKIIRENVCSELDFRKEKEISIAVGVTFVNSHQPIRYYRQVVEEELSEAKSIMKLDKKKLSLVGLSISGCKLNCYKDKRGKKKSDGFNRFCIEIEEIKSMMNNKVITNTTLHNLLINLEIEKNDEKRLLYILYFCIPNFSESKIFNEECYFKSYIISQILEDSRKKRERFFEKSKIESILMPKLKVIILFLNNNFYTNSEGGRKNIEKSKKYITSNKKVPSLLLNKPINYLLEINPKGIEKLFIQKVKINKKNIYKSANFDISLFYRAKKLIDEGKKQQVKNLFDNYYENIINVRDVINQKGEINFNRLNFNIKDFHKKYNDTEDTEWIDRLIILFEYNKQRIKYKTFLKNQDCKNS